MWQFQSGIQQMKIAELNIFNFFSFEVGERGGGAKYSKTKGSKECLETYFVQNNTKLM